MSLVVIKSLINLANGDLFNFDNLMFILLLQGRDIAKCPNISISINQFISYGLWLCSLLVCRFIITCWVKNAVPGAAPLAYCVRWFCLKATLNRLSVRGRGYIL